MGRWVITSLALHLVGVIVAFAMVRKEPPPLELSEEAIDIFFEEPEPEPAWAEPEPEPQPEPEPEPEVEPEPEPEPKRVEVRPTPKPKPTPRPPKPTKKPVPTRRRPDPEIQKRRRLLQDIRSKHEEYQETSKEVLTSNSRNTKPDPHERLASVVSPGVAQARKVAYERTVQYALQRIWRQNIPPRLDGPRRSAEILITIAEDGSIPSTNWKRKSGYEAFDVRVTATIRQVRLEPVPEGVSAPVTLLATFGDEQ